MKSSTRNNIIFSVGLVFGFIGLLAVPLGMPYWAFLPFNLVFAACLWLVVWLQRRDKRRGAIAPDSTPAVSASRAIRTRVLTLVVLVLVTLSGFWWLPFTGVGVHLDLRQRIIASLVSCIFGVAAYLLGWWYATRHRKA